MCHDSATVSDGVPEKRNADAMGKKRLQTVQETSAWRLGRLVSIEFLMVSKRRRSSEMKNVAKKSNGSEVAQ